MRGELSAATAPLAALFEEEANDEAPVAVCDEFADMAPRCYLPRLLQAAVTGMQNRLSSIKPGNVASTRLIEGMHAYALVSQGDEKSLPVYTVIVNESIYSLQ